MVFLSYTDLLLKVDKDLRECFLSGKAEDTGGLAPAKDDNAAWRKAGRKDCLVLMEVQYKIIAAGREKEVRLEGRAQSAAVQQALISSRNHQKTLESQRFQGFFMPGNL